MDNIRIALNVLKLTADNYSDYLDTLDLPEHEEMAIDIAHRIDVLREAVEILETFIDDDEE